MRLLKFLFSLLLTCGLLYLLSNPFAYKGVQAPAFGNVLNPFSGFWQNATSTSGESFDLDGYHLKGKLKAPVKVVFDDREIPHIFAQNDHDAAFMQGFLHAQNRLFQMEMATRMAAGRLSEVIAGEKALASDMAKRRYGMLAAAQNAIKGWQKDTASYSILTAYTAGINAYITQLTDKKIPLEYKVIGFEPEPWTELKTALVFKMMCEMLARTDLDVEASNALSILGEADFYKYLPDIAPNQMPIVPTGTKFNFKAAPTPPPVANGSLSDIYTIENDVEKIEGIGSNNWVVGPKKTANGKTILCGDPHLALKLPSIWYECQINTPTSNTYGVSLPGIPFIVIGFNQNIAWSPTNAGFDVAEWYKIEWKDDAHEQYKLDGQWVDVEHKVEEYHVKGRGVVKDIVKYTKFGAVVSEDAANAYNGLAFRWICHDESKNDANVFHDINNAKNHDEFVKALKNYSFPIQNFAFASNTGDYAIYTRGRLPAKAKGSGRFVTDGTVSKSNWFGDIPFEQMPTVKNHPQGFVSSANQNHVDKTYPYDVHSYYYETVRSRIINKMLAEKNNITVEEMKKMQTDVYSIEAEETVPALLANIDESKLNATAKTFLEAIKTWDFKYTKESKAAMYYDIWFGAVRKMTWDELQTDNPKAKILRPKGWAMTRMLKEEPKGKYFDIKATPEVEDATIIVTNSLNNVVDTMTRLMLLNPTIDYSGYKNTTVSHIANFGGFGRTNIPSGGSLTAINCLRDIHGPSWRMVVELGDVPKAFVVYPGGQTGNPGAKQYDEFIDKWANEEYYEAFFMLNATEQNQRVKKVFDF
jgi:penicillin G amidase